MRLDAPGGTEVVLTAEHFRSLDNGGPIPVGTRGTVSDQNYAQRGGETIIYLYNVPMPGGWVAKQRSYYVEDSAFRVVTAEELTLPEAVAA